MRHRGWPFVADLACVLALAIGGSRSHDSGGVGAVVTIAWPFALATAVAHVYLATRGRRASRLFPEGVTVLVVTYALGMLLRAISGRGMDPAFLIVAGAFLTATMLGWRVVSHLVSRRSAGSP